MNFELSLCKDDLRTYPSGELMNLSEVKSRLFFETVSNGERKRIPLEDITLGSIDRDVTITVENLDAKKKYICCLRLGDGTQKKPVFRSPILVSCK